MVPCIGLRVRTVFNWFCNLISKCLSECLSLRSIIRVRMSVGRIYRVLSSISFSRVNIRLCIFITGFGTMRFRLSFELGSIGCFDQKFGERSFSFELSQHFKYFSPKFNQSFIEKMKQAGFKIK